MGTICFDIKRVDENYVCIQHCDMNHFEYQYHLPFSFYPRERKGKDCGGLEDKKYRYVGIAVEKEQNKNIEKIVGACNDKIGFNSAVKQFFKGKDIRIIKLPFEEKVKTGNPNFPYRHLLTDMQDKFKLYCPLDLNEKYHVYTDHYEEVEPEVESVIEVDGKKKEFKRRKFEGIAPKYLNEEIEYVK